MLPIILLFVIIVYYLFETGCKDSNFFLIVQIIRKFFHCFSYDFFASLYFFTCKSVAAMLVLFQFAGLHSAAECRAHLSDIYAKVC